MPRIEEVLEAVGASKVISKLNLSKGCYQVPMKETDIPKTAFVCHQGKFEFLRMPFGVRNAPAVFQTLMDEVLEGKQENARAYMDDIVIFSDEWDQHVVHVREVLMALKSAGLRPTPPSAGGGGESMEFLGHTIGKEVNSVPNSRAESIASYKQPKTKRIADISGNGFLLKEIFDQSGRAHCCSVALDVADGSQPSGVEVLHGAIFQEYM